MALKFKEGDKVRITQEANQECWFFREGDVAEIVSVFPLMPHPYHLKFTATHSWDRYVGHVGSCAENHIELVWRDEKAGFDHTKERSQIANAKIDWFQLNEEFSSK